MFRIFATALLAASLGLAVPTSDAAQPDHRRPGQHVSVKVLPKGHHKIVHRGKSYFYSAGRFYRHSNGAYAVITAPIGAIIPALPGGYISFGIGSRRHFYFEGIYYQQVHNGYVVVEEPPDAEQALSQGSDMLIVYPAAGQTDEQRDRDRYDCHLWASDETHFDPTNPNSDPLLRSDYHRALGACLEARNYVVK